jgi:two-component system response regulator QseB
MRILWINLEENAPSAKMNTACISDFAEDLADAEIFLMARHYEAVVFADIPAHGAMQQTMQSIRKASPETALIGMDFSGSAGNEHRFLSAGGDEYVPFPQSLDPELVRLRIEKCALLYFTDEEIRIGRLRVDPREMSLLFDEVPIELRPGSFKIVHHLMLTRLTFLSKEQIIAALFEDPEYVKCSTIETAIHTIRKRLDGRFGKEFIKTLRNRGYGFVYNSE